MRGKLMSRRLWVAVILGAATPAARAQPASSDAVIDSIRPLETISAGDQRRIVEWAAAEVAQLESDARAATSPSAEAQLLRAFRDRFASQFTHARNSDAFRAQFALQSAQVFASRFEPARANPFVARALARVLVDFGRSETLDALLACLAVDDQGSRFLCARGLAALHPTIAADRAVVTRVAGALRSSGMAESNPVVLGQIYRALALPGHAGEVLDAYLGLLDQRLDARRGGALVADRAELGAFDYFRTAGVITSLSAEQKAKLAGRLAPYLRMDAERYAAAELDFDERDALERRLDALEECLSLLTGPGVGGDLRTKLGEGGQATSAAIRDEVYKWIGNPADQTPGALSQAPWNVPIGAP